MRLRQDLDDQIDLQEWLRIRKEAALEIDPETAEVDWAYGQILDPYGVEKNLPHECNQIGRVWFARGPVSDVWVSFDDIPDAVVSELRRKIRVSEEIARFEGEGIIALAALQHRIDLSSLRTDVSPAERETWTKGVNGLNSAGLRMLRLASKLLEGKPYAITTDNPETIRRSLPLADCIGASIQSVSERDGITKIVFGPPSAQRIQEHLAVSYERSRTSTG
jgi:hypothetical protein